MKKYLAGYFYDEKECSYYTNDYTEFFDKEDNKLSNDNLEEWAVWINSPWSQNHEKYEILYNCKDAYTKMDENEPIWKCVYSVIGYDGISASIIQYGNTQIEALENVQKFFQYLQDNYNASGENF